MIKLALALGLLATPVAETASIARSSEWQVGACLAWRDHLQFVIDVRARTGSGAELDLDAIREAVATLGRRCTEGHADGTARLFSLLLNLLTEEEDS